RIPFLNGGLFARTALERAHRPIVFSDDAYGALLYDVFGQFRFTAREESADWSEAAVDPEMLGRAFESLMASRERRRTGAFFTPFSLVEQLSSYALAARLGDWVRSDPTTIPAKRRADLRAALSRLTVLDPACGSGAFLVHVLERVTSMHLALGDARDIASIRRDVLTRSIFGVDVNPLAVWLCGLRLWLSVVIEAPDDDVAGVLPLPNLDRNIRVGDALAGAAGRSAPAIADAPALSRLRTRYARASGARKATLGRRLDTLERKRAVEVLDAALETLSARRRDLIVARRGRDLFGDRYRASAEERVASRELRARAVEARTSRRRIVAGGALPFSFDVHFADVAARGGFDVVIGNPPWVRVHRISKEERMRFRRDFAVARHAGWEPGAALAGAGSGFAAQIDTAALFVERAIELLASNGVAALLLPSKLWRSLAGGGVRRLVMRRTSIVRIEDHSDGAAAFDAAVYPSWIVLRRDEISSSGDIDVGVHRRNGTGVCWTVPRDALAYDRTPGAPWLLLPGSVRRAFDALRDIGLPLAESPLGRPRLGVKCGCNDAFVVKLVERYETNARVAGADGTTFLVENEYLRPLLRGEALREWNVTQGNDCIIWTHDERDEPVARLAPLARSWLSQWRPALQARSDGRSTERWWTLFRTDAARDQGPRLVWGDVGRAPRAFVLDAGDNRVPLNSCYVARCRNLPDANTGAALLNSALAQAWLNAIAEPARGGYRRYLGWTLALLPVPKNWIRAREILAPLAAAARDGHPPTEQELLEACVAAYGVSRSLVAPLVAWSME
ncbi:MAG TPA: N-6 DNA methylase, partial [Gemmatimonadaceae bacterium]|nr:N-6 DNA methylase [Gemmatimonadaceae bacterium]